MHWSDWPDEVLATLRRGAVIPASPLCLDENRDYDPRRQRALARYYLDAGSGGIAIGVHTTQFEIRDAGLYEPVLETVAETMEDWTDRPLIRIVGLVGNTGQATREARSARSGMSIAVNWSSAQRGPIWRATRPSRLRRYPRLWRPIRARPALRAKSAPSTAPRSPPKTARS